MMNRNISVPELGLIALTRAMIGAGAGLLLADYLKPHHKRAIGWTLLSVGALSTIPLAIDLLVGHRPHPESTDQGESSHEEEPVYAPV